MRMRAVTCFALAFSLLACISMLPDGAGAQYSNGDDSPNNGDNDDGDGHPAAGLASGSIFDSFFGDPECVDIESDPFYECNTNGQFCSRESSGCWAHLDNLALGVCGPFSDSDCSTGSKSDEDEDFTFTDVSCASGCLIMSDAFASKLSEALEIDYEQSSGTSGRTTFSDCEEKERLLNLYVQKGGEAISMGLIIGLIFGMLALSIVYSSMTYCCASCTSSGNMDKESSDILYEKRCQHFDDKGEACCPETGNEAGKHTCFQPRYDFTNQTERKYCTSVILSRGDLKKAIFAGTWVYGWSVMFRGLDVALTWLFASVAMNDCGVFASVFDGDFEMYKNAMMVATWVITFAFGFEFVAVLWRFKSNFLCPMTVTFFALVLGDLPLAILNCFYQSGLSKAGIKPDTITWIALGVKFIMVFSVMAALWEEREVYKIVQQGRKERRQERAEAKAKQRRQSSSRQGSNTRVSTKPSRSSSSGGKSKSPSSGGKSKSPRSPQNKVVNKQPSSSGKSKSQRSPQNKVVNKQPIKTNPLFYEHDL